MKKLLFLLFSMLFILSILYLPNTFAKDSTQFSLPEGAKARFGKGSIFQIEYSPDGTRFAAASSIGVWLYDTTTYKEIALLTGHTGSVSCIAFSPDGNTLASGSSDKTVRLWDMKTRKHKQTLTGHLHGIYSVAFSPDGRTLIGGSTGERGGGEIFGAQILMWDTATGKHIRTLTAQGQVNSLAFSPDGKTFASGEAWPGYVVQLWDADTGKKLHTLIGHTDWVNSVTFGTDADTLVSASNDGSVCIWNVNTGEQKRALFHNGQSANTLAISSNGNFLVCGYFGSILAFDFPSGRHRHTIDFNSGSVTSVAFSPDGKTLVSAILDRNPLRIWDVATWTQIHAVVGYTHLVLDIAFSPDNSTLASGGFDPAIYLWDVTTGKQKNKLIGDTNYISCVAFSPDGSTLASGSYGSTVFLWDVSTNTKKHTFSSKHEDLIRLRSVTFSPDLNIHAGVSFKTVHLWDVVKGELKWTRQGHTGEVHSVAFSPNARILASGGDVEHIGEDHSFGYKGIRLWDVETGEQKHTIKGKMGDIYSVVFSPDGLTLASGEGWADYAIRLWDIDTREQKQILKGHTDDVNSVVFSPDGRTIASGSADNTIRLWDVTTGKHIRTFKGHTGDVNNITFNTDGSMLASTSYDGTILLWSIATADGAK